MSYLIIFGSLMPLDISGTIMEVVLNAPGSCMTHTSLTCYEQLVIAHQWILLVATQHSQGTALLTRSSSPSNKAILLPLSLLPLYRTLGIGLPATLLIADCRVGCSFAGRVWAPQSPSQLMLMLDCSSCSCDHAYNLRTNCRSQ